MLVTFAEMLLTISTTGYLECSSITKQSPVYRGPQKSALSLSHGLLGCGLIFSGLRLITGFSIDKQLFPRPLH